MFKVALPNGRELMVAWNSSLPCTTISAALVEELGLEKFKMKRVKYDYVQGIIGGSLGGERKQYYFVKELILSLPVSVAPDRVAPDSALLSQWASKAVQAPSTDIKEIRLGPLLVLENPITDLAMGADFMRNFPNSSMASAPGYYTFYDSNGPIVCTTYPLEYFDAAGNPVHGSSTWSWTPDVELDTCANPICRFRFPNLMNCSQCRSTTYCSRVCQRAHWSQHKKVCNK
jgi:hypothetical protein